MGQEKMVPLIVAGLLVFTGCSSAHAKLVAPDDGWGALCVPASAKGELFVGHDFLRNDGKSRAEVSKVELVEENNLEVRGFGILGDSEAGDRGAMNDPLGTLAPGRGIEAGDSAAVQVVLALGNPSEAGNAKSLRVTYRSSGGTWEKSTATVTTLEVLPAGQVCE